MVPLLLAAAAVAATPPGAVEITLSSDGSAKGSAATRSIPADFFGLTLDAWGMAGGYTEKGELTSTTLPKWLRSLRPITLRVGGTNTDNEVWPLGEDISADIAESSRNITKNVSVATWAAVTKLAEASGVDLIVGVSGTLRKWAQPGVPWSTTNARAFLEWNKARGVKLAAIEIGNEPGIWGQFKTPPVPTPGNMHVKVTAAQHAADWAVLQGLLAELYPSAAARPLAIGPDTCCNDGSENTLQALLPHDPHWNVTTIHLYAKGPDKTKGTPTAGELLDAARRNTICEHVKQQASWVANSSRASAPLWVGEGGGSFYTRPGGGYLHQFGGALNLLNTLGCTASTGLLQKFLKHDIFENMIHRGETDWDTPYPTFFMAKLWHDLVTPQVGASTVVDAVATRAAPTCPEVAHCNCTWTDGGSKCGKDDGSECYCRCCCQHAEPTPGACKWQCPLGRDDCHAIDLMHTWAFKKAAGGTTVLLIDLRDSTEGPTPVSIPCSGASVGLFSLTPTGSAKCEPGPSGAVPQCDPVLNAPTMALNGVELAASSAGDLPAMAPKKAACVGGKVTVHSAPLSATIVVVG